MCSASFISCYHEKKELQDWQGHVYGMGVGTDLPRLGHELGRNENGESLFPVDAVCRLPLCSWRGEPFTPWIACGMALILAGIVVVVQAPPATRMREEK